MAFEMKSTSLNLIKSEKIAFWIKDEKLTFAVSTVSILNMF